MIVMKIVKVMPQFGASL